MGMLALNPIGGQSELRFKPDEPSFFSEVFHLCCTSRFGSRRSVEIFVQLVFLILA
jgi:hypothetical protein